MVEATIISNARIVTPTRDFTGALVIEDGRIADLREGQHYPEGIDAGGAWLIPGVIDLHTDYAEKEIAPRPSAQFPLELAFHFMDQRALASGLTTVLGAVRVSEDKEKGGSIWRRDGIELGKRYDQIAPHLKARHLMHVRWDPNFEPADEKIAALQQFQTLGNIVYNENIPGQRQFRDIEAQAQKLAERRGTPFADELAAMEERIRVNSQLNNRPQVRDAFSGDVPLGSHDDTTIDHVIEAHAMGCSIAEMPTTMEAARKAKELGLIVVMGAPNYYRGGSHCGNLSCPEAIAEGLVDVLCSDYHFPSLLGSIVKMLGTEMPPCAAVNLVTRNAAKALNREHLGAIELGKVADLTLFHPRAHFAEVTHTWVNGHLVFASTLTRPHLPASGRPATAIATV